MLIETPCSISIIAMSVNPPRQARCSAVYVPSLEFGSALARSARSTCLRRPDAQPSASSIDGNLRPVVSTVVLSALHSSSRSSRLPSIARLAAVTPCALAAATSAFSCSSSRTPSKLPCCVARCSGRICSVSS
eukprot:4189255-Prymnesium_polylepis.1